MPETPDDLEVTIVGSTPLRSLLDVRSSAIQHVWPELLHRDGWAALRECLTEDARTEVLLLEPREDFDPALIGICHQAGNRCALYSKAKVMEILERLLPTPEEELEQSGESNAEAQYNYNTSGSAGWGFPMFLLDEEEIDGLDEEAPAVPEP